MWPRKNRFTEHARCAFGESKQTVFYSAKLTPERIAEIAKFMRTDVGMYFDQQFQVWFADTVGAYQRAYKLSRDAAIVEVYTAAVTANSPRKPL